MRRLIDFAEARELARLGLPMVATQFCIMAMGFLDTAMAGNYASVDLAGVALGGNVLWPLFMLMSGLNMALTPMSAQLRGEGKMTAIGPLTWQGLWLAVGAAVITALVLVNAAPIFALFDVDPEAAAIGERYLDAAAWGIPGVMLYVTLRYTCEGLGKTLPPMLIAASALVINGVLNYIFIYGKLGMPAMGGEGCGWATALTMWIELGLILLLLRRPWFRETGILERFEKLDPSRVASLVRVGLPIGLTVFLEMGVFSVLGFLVGSLGVTALAAHSIDRATRVRLTVLKGPLQDANEYRPTLQPRHHSSVAQAQQPEQRATARYTRHTSTTARIKAAPWTSNSSSSKRPSSPSTTTPRQPRQPRSASSTCVATAAARTSSRRATPCAAASAATASSTRSARSA